MNVLEDVTFQTLMASLGDKMELLMVPDITTPNCQQTMQETQYEFRLERWILSRHEPTCLVPSCPPLSLMFSSPQGPRRSSLRTRDLWALDARPRSHSLNSTDSGCLRNRSVRFNMSGCDQDDGYSEDDEGSSPEEPPQRSRSRERPRSAAPRDSASSSYRRPHDCDSTSPLTVRGQKAPCPPDGRKPYGGLDQHMNQFHPVTHSQKTFKKKKQRPLAAVGRRFSSNPPSVGPSSSNLLQQQQQRPSSAGPLYRTSRKKVLTTGSPEGLYCDSAAELLSALSLEERTLLGSITQKGYPLLTAVTALQKTGYRSPEQVLKYLVTSDRLCQLGYDQAQVEEALEMFPNCESKAAEFLRLLTQFNEMGFQQSAIKEVLLVHENHHEKALEELMTRLA